MAGKILPRTWRPARRAGLAAESFRGTAFGGKLQNAARSGRKSGRLGAGAVGSKDYPQESLALYKELAERAIAEKNRSSYQSAAQFLVRMKELHRRLHTEAEWDVYIETLRARHARLPALQDELRKAKL